MEQNNAQNVDLTPIVEKVQKLLAKAASTDSEAEAAAFTAKANQLLLEHNLSMTTIESHKAKGKNPIMEGLKDMGELFDKREGQWWKPLFFRTAEFNLCKAVFIPSTKPGALGYFSIMGREDNSVIALMIFDYLVNSIRRIEAKSWKEYEGSQKRGAYRRDFYNGCSARLIERLREDFKQKQQSNIQITALVKVNDGELQDFVKERFPHLSTSKARSVKLRDGFFEGSQKANNISLNGQLGNSDSARGHLKG